MKKQKIEEEFKKYKYKYLFLITICILGFISGIIFSNILSYSDFKDVSSVVKDYFLNLKDNVDINYLSNFIIWFWLINYWYYLKSVYSLF